MRGWWAARSWGRAGQLALLLALAGLVVPASAVHPVSISLTEVETAKQVDFDDGVVWLLVLGSDARPGEELTEARADAIQLVGLDLHSGRAVGIGIPRDYYVDLPGPDAGLAKINTAMQGDGGPDRAAAAVADLVGIEAAYVLVTGFDGFRDMVNTIGGIEVRSPRPFTDDHTGITVDQGVNDFDGSEALAYARSRRAFGAGDLVRSANQQRAMLGILRSLTAHEDEAGFMERGTLAALAGFDTDLSPVELYRLAQAATQVRPDRVTTCVLSGRFGVAADGASVVFPYFEQAQRIGADAADNVRLDRTC
jgi:LCP family protein required for cell wall assembly